MKEGQNLGIFFFAFLFGLTLSRFLVCVSVADKLSCGKLTVQEGQVVNN